MEKVRLYQSDDGKSITIILDDKRTYDTAESELTLSEAVMLLRRLAETICAVYEDRNNA